MPRTDFGDHLHFTVFGAVELVHLGESVDLGGRTQDQCLLGLLLVSVNRVVSIDEIIHLLWEGQPPRSARTQVKNSVHRLRKVLPPVDVELFTIGAGYQLTTHPGRVDLHRALHLGRKARYAASPRIAADLLGAAMSLWRLPVLAKFGNERIGRFVSGRVGPELADLRQRYQEFTTVALEESRPPQRVREMILQ